MKETGGNDFAFDIDDAVRRYADMVYRLAVVNTRDQYEAEDAFQEVFVKLFRYKDSITSEEHLKAWLIRVTVNQCRTMATSAWNQKKVPMESVAEFADETAEEVCNAMETAEEYEEVYDAVKSLPEKYREVIHLFYYEDLAISEIARVLNRNEATVKTQLKRGRSLLGEKLKGSFKDG